METFRIRLAPLSNYSPAMLDRLVSNPEPVRSLRCADLDGRSENLQARSARLRARPIDPLSRPRRDRFCGLWWMGHGGRQVVRLSYFLGQSARIFRKSFAPPDGTGPTLSELDAFIAR